MQVLVDRAGGEVWVLDPELVALDLANGGERWRNTAIRGDALWRVGRRLMATGQSDGHQATLGIIDLDDASRTKVCAIALPSPQEATNAALHGLAVEPRQVLVHER